MNGEGGVGSQKVAELAKPKNGEQELVLIE